jgi:hypothetical protein
MRIRFNKVTKEWDTLAPEDEHSHLDIQIDGLRKKYLDQVKKDLQNDLDHVEIISGSVGSGKSTLGRLDCRYVSDERFHPTTHIIRDVNDIKTVIKNAQKGDGILIDEGSGIFAGTDTMTKKTKYANFILDVCRQKNLLIVISAPNFHRLTSAVAVDRATTLTRVYIDTRTNKRGRFAFYGKRAKEKLYRFAKVNYGSLKGAKPKYRGRFGEDKTFTKEYLKMKDDTLDMALNSLGGKDEVKAPTPQEIILKYRIDLVRNNMDMPIKELANVLKVTTRTIDNYRQIVKNSISKENSEILRTKSLKQAKNEPGA